MENNTSNLEELFEKVKVYADTRINLFKLKAINKASSFLSTLVSTLILIAILVFVIFFISLAIALLIGEWIGSAYLGFFIVAGIYIIIGLIIYSARSKFLREPISNKLLKELLD
ncbi:MAG: phage holin family protein [Ginsengibacter sp.]